MGSSTSTWGKFPILYWKSYYIFPVSLGQICLQWGHLHEVRLSTIPYFPRWCRNRSSTLIKWYCKGTTGQDFQRNHSMESVEKISNSHLLLFLVTKILACSHLRCHLNFSLINPAWHFIVEIQINISVPQKTIIARENFLPYVFVSSY